MQYTYIFGEKQEETLLVRTEISRPPADSTLQHIQRTFCCMLAACILSQILQFFSIFASFQVFSARFACFWACSECFCVFCDVFQYFLSAFRHVQYLLRVLRHFLQVILFVLPFFYFPMMKTSNNHRSSGCYFAGVIASEYF